MLTHRVKLSLIIEPIIFKQKYPMKALLVISILLLAPLSFGQKLKFKVEGHKDTTVHLVKWYGKGRYYADTAEMKNGFVEFDGSKQQAGVLILFLPSQDMLEFIYNNEEVYIETKLPDLMGNAKIKKSEENKIFYPYVRMMSSKNKDAQRWKEQQKNHEEGSEMYEKLQNQIDNATEEVEAYQANLVQEHGDMLVGKIVKMSMDIEIPEAPKDEAGNIIDSNFRFYYYRQHFWDNIDLTDSRLVRTPVFHNKLSQYFSKNMMVQHWDTVIHYAFDFCDRLDPKGDLFQYCVSWITSTYEQSKIMGMDKVFVYMGERYYCSLNEEGKSPAHWMPEEKLKDLCEKVSTHKDLVMGAVPPNLILRDTTDKNWQDFYSLDKEYVILYFWDPECGHCKKITPKLQTLYEKKFRDRNIEIFAIGKAVGEDFDKWKAFIQKNNLEFINVAVTDDLYTKAMEDARQFVPKYTTLKSLNYQKTYDIFATPKMWVLDKDKKIIAKSLTISQLEDFLDRLQEKEDSEKLFPPEENKEDEQMH